MFYKVWIILNYVLSVASIAILAWKAAILVKVGMFSKSALFNAFDMIGEKICRSFIISGSTNYCLYIQDKRQRSKIFRH